MSARDEVIETIKQEHYALGMVVSVLRRLVADVVERRAEPDFALYAAALCYFDEFCERCHHPKEEEFLFRVLRRRTPRHDAVLDDLDAEHVRAAQLTAGLHRALVQFQGGAPHGPDRFKAAADAYAAMMDVHMRKEELLLASAGDDLSHEDWEAVAAAFDENEDPLFGADRRAEFNRLYLRILNLLPRKMAMPLRHPRSEA